MQSPYKPTVPAQFWSQICARRMGDNTKASLQDPEIAVAPFQPQKARTNYLSFVKVVGNIEEQASVVHCAEHRQFWQRPRRTRRSKRGGTVDADMGPVQPSDGRKSPQKERRRRTKKANTTEAGPERRDEVRRERTETKKGREVPVHQSRSRRSRPSASGRESHFVDQAPESGSSQAGHVSLEAVKRKRRRMARRDYCRSKCGGTGAETSRDPGDEIAS